ESSACRHPTIVNNPGWHICNICSFTLPVIAVDAEQVSSLGSEEDDEVGLWSLEPQDCHESPNKTSLTPSEVTEEPSSPAYFTRLLSPGSRICWDQVESEAPGEEDATYASTDREGDQEPLRMYCKS
ncbi:hypothetical protein GOODEAATRI_002804, partial [Goodea atripinnis]